MAQLVTTILTALLLLTVPLGVVQVHTMAQMKSEMLDVSLAATKFLSNRGGNSDVDVQTAVTQFIWQEMSTKSYQTDMQKLTVEVERTKAAEPTFWSHEDEFRIRISIPYPAISTLFTLGEKSISIVRTGTINIMSYDL